MIQVLNQKKATATQWERVDTHVIDSRDLHIVQDGMFTHIYMNFSLFFISYPEKAAAEVHRTLAPTGTAFITTWALLGYVPLLQRTQHAVRPDLPLWLGPVPEVWMQPEKLVETPKVGGFRAENIIINNHSVSMKFAEWTMDALINFTASSVIMITKGWSDQEKAKFDTELRNNFTEARQNEEEVEMTAWVALARK
jgi:ubiquinone/menaquinone biosynthesis C-methylase UbiE